MEEEVVREEKAARSAACTLRHRSWGLLEVGRAAGERGERGERHPRGREVGRAGRAGGSGKVHMGGGGEVT